HGFEHAFDRAPLKGNLHVWPAGGRPMVLGVSATGPAVLDLASGTLREWPDTIHGAQCTFGGIGPSWRPDHFIFTGHRPGDLPWNCQPYRSRRLLPTLVTEPDAGPAVSGFQAWATGEIAPGRWVLTSDDHTLAFDCRSGVCVEGPDLFWTGGATQVLLSPRGDRALLDYFRPRMLDPESMTIAYRLEQYRWVVDAAFAPTGDTVFVAGQAAYPATGGLMQAIRTDDGAMLADIATATPGGTIISPSGVGLDPVGPWIYLAGEVPLDSLHLPALLVIDRASLRPAALLRAAEPDPWLWAPYDRLTIVPAPSEQAVYLVWETLQYDPPARPTRVYRFGRPP
ncbi:MAG TPA: hypothetical protein VFH97_01090, partial [Gemmatimonadales bacterium]|nr:hypothetical protein [Gemmatimonadales bacterium]